MADGRSAPRLHIPKEWGISDVFPPDVHLNSRRMAEGNAFRTCFLKVAMKKQRRLNPVLRIGFLPGAISA